MPASIRKLAIALSLAFATIAAGTGCSSVDSIFDCQAVCTKYKDCYDNAYDVGKCRDSCRTRSANDSTVRTKADQCEACISNMSCVPATFSCATSCAAIVP